MLPTASSASWACSSGCGTVVNDPSQVIGKNDWGINGSGYFYISYYDQTLDDPETLVFDNDLDGDEFISHVYDYLPATDGFYELTSSSVMSSANVFTANEDEQIVSISTRTTEPNSRVTFALYKLNDDAQNPTDGELIERQSWDIEYKGFHRFDLDNPFRVTEGQKFSIVSTVSRMEGDQRKYDISASKAISKERAEMLIGTWGERAYYGTSVVNKGESAYYLNGEWQDWADYQQNSEQFKQNNTWCVVDNFSIKAYALPWDEPEPEPDPEPTPEPTPDPDTPPVPTPDKPSSKDADKHASPKALPQTGDETNALPVAFLLVSGSVVLLLGRRLRKDDH